MSMAVGLLKPSLLGLYPNSRATGCISVVKQNKNGLRRYFNIDTPKVVDFLNRSNHFPLLCFLIKLINKTCSSRDFCYLYGNLIQQATWPSRYGGDLIVMGVVNREVLPVLSCWDWYMWERRRHTSTTPPSPNWVYLHRRISIRNLGKICRNRPPYYCHHVSETCGGCLLLHYSGVLHLLLRSFLTLSSPLIILSKWPCPQRSCLVEMVALVKKSTKDSRLQSDLKEAKASPNKITNIITETLKTSSEGATFEFHDISPNSMISIQIQNELEMFFWSAVEVCYYY